MVGREELEAAKVAEVVLTGGPCAGKTTGLVHLSQTLRARGWRVLVVPEVATTVISGGLGDIGTLMADRDRAVAVQTRLLAMQRALRDSYRALADALDEDKVVILYDRGECDIAAYLPDGTFGGVLAGLGLDLVDVRDSYDAVVHLTTAADGAEHAYTLANNTARSETVEQAVRLDRATLACWVGHPHLAVVGNEGEFDDKLSALTATVLRALGDPTPFEFERKFSVAVAPSRQALADAGAVGVDIVQTYLVSPDGEQLRVRRRAQAGAASFTYTRKLPVAGTQARVEVERPISKATYEDLLTLADPDLVAVEKTRWCFVHDGHYFELDEVHAPVSLWLLEVEVADFDEPVSLPGWLDLGGEVTGQDAWSNATLAASG
jgi:CYTH domain-containing protein/predicted ATPase